MWSRARLTEVPSGFKHRNGLTSPEQSTNIMTKCDVMQSIAFHFGTKFVTRSWRLINRMIHMLPTLSLLLFFTATAFAIISIVMTLRESGATILSALRGPSAKPIAGRYRIRKTRSAGVRTIQPMSSSRTHAAA